MDTIRRYSMLISGDWVDRLEIEHFFLTDFDWYAYQRLSTA